MQINDLIFKELIKRGYSLEGKTRIWNIADSKLWYLTSEQAQGFLNLEKSESYQTEIIDKEMNLIKNHLSDLFKRIGNNSVNIVDLGCGDGKKAIIFIKSLNNKIKVRYCPIDISGYMVESALRNIKKLGIKEVVEFQWNISDFENLENISSLLRKDNFKKNLFLLLGNTLGNFEFHELMYEIRSSMKSGDILLIGNGLNNKKIKDILSSYNSGEVEKWLSHIPLQLGFSKNEVKLDVKFKNSRVELSYVLSVDKTISFQDKIIHFNKGDQILVAFSYKYTLDDFRRFMNLYFDDVSVYDSKDRSYALALCVK